MASICAKSERYIGTEGGGMDQAIAFMAVAGIEKNCLLKLFTTLVPVTSLR